MCRFAPFAVCAEQFAVENQAYIQKYLLKVALVAVAAAVVA